MARLGIQLVLFIGLFAIIPLFTEAYDPDPLQDFCIAVNDTKPRVSYYWIFNKSCTFSNCINFEPFTKSVGLLEKPYSEGYLIIATLIW